MKITMRIYIDILLTALRGRMTPRIKITALYRFKIIQPTNQLEQIRLIAVFLEIPPHFL